MHQFVTDFGLDVRPRSLVSIAVVLHWHRYERLSASSPSLLIADNLPSLMTTGGLSMYQTAAVLQALAAALLLRVVRQCSRLLLSSHSSDRSGSNVVRGHREVWSGHGPRELIAMRLEYALDIMPRVPFSGRRGALLQQRGRHSAARADRAIS
jgi:hypothetical protein